MHRDDALTAALTEFARRLSESQTVEGVLRSLGDLCTQLLPVTGVGVLLLEDADVVVGTTNSELGDVAEHLEAELQEGPCVEAIRTVERTIVPDLCAEADRWPAFGPRAVEAGVRSVHGLPMTGAGEVVGSLNIVHDEPLRLSDEQLATAQVLSDVAVSYILAARLHEERGRLADQLQHALDSRVVIEQAKGMLAERHATDVRAAFDRLRHHARANQRAVRAVAAEVVAGTLRL